MSETLFVIAWVSVLSLIVLYLAIGFVGDVIEKAVTRRRQRALSALSIVLFESDLEAESFHIDASRLSRRALLPVIQTLALDLDGQARSRLQKLVHSCGLERHILRRSKSCRWRVRIQAAQLQYLVSDPTLDRSRLLRDRHNMVRARAVESLTTKQAVELIPDLLELLAEPDKAVRRAVKQCMVGLGAQIVPDLVDVLSGDTSRALWSGQLLEVLEVAAEIPDSRLVGQLTRHSGCQDALVRKAATRGLGNGRGHGVERILVQTLTDSDAEVRVEALSSLGRVHAVKSVANIGRLLRDPTWAVRTAAGATLDMMGPAGSLMLRLYLVDEDPFARDMARQVLDARAARGSVTPPMSNDTDGLVLQ